MTGAPRIKFCGITNHEDAQHSVAAGAWAIGLIFHRASPRRCRQEDAIEIVASVRREVETVGVFVNPTLEVVTDAADRVGFSILQLHGDEGPAFCAEAARRTGCRVIKAARVRFGSDVRELGRFRTDFHLLDAHTPGIHGGTGETFDWALTRSHTGRPLILSGGLNLENVAEAISATSPWAVDVASGIEREPGHKDPAKLNAFAAAVRATAPPVSAPAEPSHTHAVAGSAEGSG